VYLFTCQLMPISVYTQLATCIIDMLNLDRMMVSDRVVITMNALRTAVGNFSKPMILSVQAESAKQHSVLGLH